MNTSTQRLQVGVRIPPCLPANRVANAAAEAERRGFDAIWLPDAPLMWRDPWTCLTLAVAATRHIDVGVAVTNPITRHPAVTASIAATVAELAQGRLTVAVGTGNSGVRTLGRHPARQAELGEALSVLRTLLRGRGRAVDFGGGPVRLVGATDPPPRVWSAATGPTALVTAGTHADGVILDVGLDLDVLSDAIARVRNAASSAGRDPDAITVATIAHVRITGDIPGCAGEAAPLFAGLGATPGGRAALTHAGIPIPELPKTDGLDPDWMHASYPSLLDDYISDESAATFVRRWCLWGTPAELDDRLTALEGIGVDQVILHHGGHQNLPDLAELAVLSPTQIGPRQVRGSATDPDAWNRRYDPDAPYGIFLSMIQAYCHPEVYNDAYDDLIRIVRCRYDNPRIGTFTRQLVEVMIDPAVLPAGALDDAAEYDDGSDVAFLRRLWRDLYPGRPYPTTPLGDSAGCEAPGAPSDGA